MDFCARNTKSNKRIAVRVNSVKTKILGNVLTDVLECTIFQCLYSVICVKIIIRQLANAPFTSKCVIAIGLSLGVDGGSG